MSIYSRRFGCFAGTLAVTLIAGVSVDQTAHGAANQPAFHAGPDRIVTAALHEKVRNIVVIYAENRAFDNLYGNFPGAHGLREVVDEHGQPRSAYIPQKDRDGTVLATLPQTWGGVTAAGVTPVVTQAASGGLPNAPFSVETAFTPAAGSPLSTLTVPRDLYHRLYENQLTIAGGKNTQCPPRAHAG